MVSVDNCSKSLKFTTTESEEYIQAFKFLNKHAFRLIKQMHNYLFIFHMNFNLSTINVNIYLACNY